jgi:hypothetical protein
MTARKEGPCEACPSNHSTSAVASGSVMACLCAAGYTGPNGGSSCTVCPAGSFKSHSGSVPCELCPSGTYVGEEGATLCLECRLHMISPRGSVSVHECVCDRGFTGDANCSACASGSYKSVNGSQPCLPCPVNTVSPEASPVLESCICNAGFSGADGSECRACDFGEYKPTNGSASCSTCDKGKYQSLLAQTSGTSCQACPDLSWSDAGARNCSCFKGFSGLQDACSPCNASTYKQTNGSAACTPCPPGTSSPAAASALTLCRCNQGYESELDGIACSACAAGKYKSFVGTGACVDCAVAKYSTEMASVQETDCLACPQNQKSPPGSESLFDCSCNQGWTGPNGIKFSKVLT